MNEYEINPFADSVKDIRTRSEFVAVSPKLRSFKEEVLEILDTSRQNASRMYAIIGNLGHGKSHINHYLYYKAQEKSDVLVSYVSCKRLVEDLGEKSLYRCLLNELLMDLMRASPDEVRSIIEDRYNAYNDNPLLNHFISTHPGTPNEWHENDRKIYKTLLDAAELDRESFFSIIASVLENESVGRAISRVVFIIDEFELFDQERHRKYLEQIWAMREDITKNPRIVWVFSCAGPSWDRLSTKSIVKDMLGQRSLTRACFLPEYDKTDRLEIIYSRMLSRSSDYHEEDREEYSSSAEMERTCFPFYNRRIGKIVLRGSEVAETISRPALTPRMLMTICHDYYADFSRYLVDAESEVEPFDRSWSDLFQRHMFDLIDKKKFDDLENLTWEMISSESKRANGDLFGKLFESLFRVYLSKRVNSKSTPIPFETISQHMDLINDVIHKTLGLRMAIGPGLVKEYALVERVEKELRQRCLRPVYDPETQKEVLEFNITDFQPNLDSPSEEVKEFHQFLVLKSAGVSIDENRLEALLIEFYGSLGRRFSDQDIVRMKKDLEEFGKVQPQTGGGFRVVVGPRPSSDWSREIRRIDRGNVDWNGFFEWVGSEKSVCFMPPLNKGKEGQYLQLEISSKNIKGKCIIKSYPLFFWDQIPDDVRPILSKNELSLIMVGDETWMEQLGKKDIAVEKIASDIFNMYRTKDAGNRAIFIEASSDYTDAIPSMTWAFFAGHRVEIIKAATVLGDEVSISGLESKIKTYFNNRPGFIREQPYLRWDECDFYGLRLKEFGKEKSTQYISMLAKVIRDNKIVCDPRNVDLAKDLIDIYPWLVMEKGELCKRKGACRSSIEGRSVDDVARSLMELLSNQSKRLESVCDEFIIKRERKAGILDRSDKKEKAAVRSPLMIMLRALTEAFPGTLHINDGEISSGSTPLPPRDVALLDWVFSSIEEEDNQSWILEMLVGNAEGEPKKLLLDLGVGSRIFKEIASISDDTDLANCLFALEMSTSNNEQVERFKFLQQAERIGHILLDSIKSEFSALANLQDSGRPEIVRNIEDWNNWIAQEGIAGGLREQLQKAIKATNVERITEADGMLKNETEKVKEEILGEGLGGGAGYDIWLKALKQNPNLTNRVHSLLIDIERTRQYQIEAKGKFDRARMEIFHGRLTALTNFDRFIREAISEFHDQRQKNVLQSIHKGVIQVSGGQNCGMAAFKEVSLAEGSIAEAKVKLLGFSESEISEVFKRTREEMAAYHDLSIKYATDHVKVEDDFANMVNDIKRIEESDLNEIDETIGDGIIFHRHTSEEPRSQRGRFLLKARDLTMKSISKEHRATYEEADAQVRNGSVFAWLLMVKEQQGIEGLVRKLEFLREMERVGLLTYRQDPTLTTTPPHANSR